MRDDPASAPRPLRVPLKKYLHYAEADSGGADFPWYGFDDNLSADRSGEEVVALERVSARSCVNVSARTCVKVRRSSGSDVLSLCQANVLCH